MNKITDTLWHTYDSIKPATSEWIERVSCFIRRKPYHAYRPKLSPRWQQLELPLSHTPVQRWHR